jgi:hypothetical protein
MPLADDRIGPYYILVSDVKASSHAVVPSIGELGGYGFARMAMEGKGNQLGNPRRKTVRALRG